jgi:hypothetical protein
LEAGNTNAIKNKEIHTRLLQLKRLEIELTKIQKRFKDKYGFTTPANNSNYSG